MMAEHEDGNQLTASEQSTIIQELHSELHQQQQNPQVLTSINRIASTYQDRQWDQQLVRINQEGVEHVRREQYQKAVNCFEACKEMVRISVEEGNSKVGLTTKVAVINNMTMAYQYQEQSLKAATYLQQLLAMLQQQLQKPQYANISLILNQKYRSTQGLTNQIQQQSVYAFFELIWQQSKYQLQLSGLNSQNQQHQESLKNARKSLRMLKNLGQLTQQYISLSSTKEYVRIALLKELANTREEFSTVDLQQLREEHKFICGGNVDNDQVYHESYRLLNQQEKQWIRNADIHSLFDLQPLQIHQQQSPTPQQSYFSHMQKIMFMLGCYFAISVEQQQLQSLSSHYYQNSTCTITCHTNRQAESTLLSALTMAYRYIPQKVTLMKYLQEQYKGTYMRQESNRSINSRSDRTINRSERKEDKEEEIVVDVSIKELAEKYRGYLLEKEVQIEEEEESCSKINNQLDVQNIKEQKKSKKLVELLKPEQNQEKRTENKYFNELASIDSFSMANSQSTQQQPSIINSQGHFAPINFHRRQPNKKQKYNLKIPKPITELSEKEEWNSGRNTKRIEFVRSSPHSGLRQKKGKSKSVNKEREKSRSNRKGQLKGKQEGRSKKGKQGQSKHITLRQYKSQSLVSKNKSRKKSLGKKNMTLSSQSGFMMNSKKKQPVIKFWHTNPPKLAKFYSPSASVKDSSCSLKFNKVHSKINLIKSEERLPINRIEGLAGIGEKPVKSKSKSKSVSMNTKKSSKSKSLSSNKRFMGKKSNKKGELNPSVKIYTSTTIIKKH